MEQDMPPVTVLATFNDQEGAEIACALLVDASIQSGEPEITEDGSWLVSVRNVRPDVAGRAEVILRSARARETMMIPDRQLLGVAGNSRRGRIDRKLEQGDSART
jgi:hypothetical protein